MELHELREEVESGRRMLSSEAVDHLREIGEPYVKLQKELAQVGGPYLSTGYEFPMDVQGYEESHHKGEATVYVWGSWTRRGCTDKESCHLPSAYVYGTLSEQANILSGIRQQIANLQGAKAAAAEKAQHAEYLRLKQIYEPGNG
ncbi:hypothetical protein HOU02_gp273 [Caulobacter phage CcrBL9]|uniref:Uncharacterized protein n=1 Tax=Caulobacter phage CcrBL9 TaxID=2283270 RepID=A0A385EF36_9CAUD|nr:hypothetical protein HOU02_gp273 [Caulobacter phage CcrBL9]AXQ69452.1 hypothetical protein CcrBL9_gp428 [Caulobacter phage CcrBL9]